MKKYIFSSLILFMFTATTPMVAQTKGKQKEEPKQEQPTTEFQDVNANGIDDAKESPTGNKKKMKRVKFIDTDGDGICDGRASGAGLKLRMHGNNSAKQLHKGKK